MAEAVQQDEAYAEEAFHQGAPDVVARVLAAVDFENASPAALELAGALREALRVFKEQSDAGRKTARKRSLPPLRQHTHGHLSGLSADPHRVRALHHARRSTRSASAA